MRVKIHKNWFLLASLLLVSVHAQAADPGASADPNFWQTIFGNITLIAGIILIAVSFLTIVRTFNIMLRMEELRLLKEKGLEEYAEAKKVHKEPWWKNLKGKLESAVPIEREKDVLFDHDYDGIRELDNKLPPWWVALFYLTIIVGIVYIGVQHFSDFGMSSAEQYEQEMEVAKAQVAEYMSKQADSVNETNVEALTEADALAAGEAIFKTNCAVCHGQLGEGGVGPNMTDDYWIHGGGIKNIFKVITNGVPEKGMVSWKAQLRASEIQKVSSYILTLRGTKPPNQKEPQGELYNPDSE